MDSNQSTELQLTGRRASQAELARDLGVSRQAVSDLVKRQILSVDADGKIDVDQARQHIAERVRPSAKTAATAAPRPSTSPAAVSAPPAQDTITSYHVAKTLREAAEANIAQLKLKRLLAELVDRETAVQATFTAFRTLRDNLNYLPRRISSQVATLTSARDVQLALEEAIRETLAAFKDRVMPQLIARMGAPDSEDNAQ